MSLIVVEALDAQAMESLQTNPHIRVVGPVQETTPVAAVEKPRVRRQWAGSLSDADAEALRKHVEEVRNEWERDF